MNVGKTNRVLLGLGSNILPKKYIPAAITALKKKVTVIAVSNFYQTPAIGCEGAADFINGCVLIETIIPPRTLKFDILRVIETSLGRKRDAKNKYGARTIDIDILLYEEIILQEEGLQIPDPDLLKRNFLLFTGQEIAGEMRYMPEGKPLNAYTLPKEGLTLLELAVT